MECKHTMFRWKKHTLLSAMLLAAIGVGNPASGQANTDITASIANDYLIFEIGVVALNAGGMGLYKTNPTTFGGADDILWRRKHGVDEIGDTKIIPPIVHRGTWLYVRTDGGSWLNRNGWDYYFGGPHKLPPNYTYFNIVNNRMEMEWFSWTPGTPAFITPNGNNAVGGGEPGGGGGTGGGGAGGGGGGGGTTTAFNPNISIQAQISFVHDFIRMKYTVVNNDTGIHTVELGFCQDIVAQPRHFGEYDGPLRIPGMPEIYKETLMGGTNVPKYWETFANLTTGSTLVYPTLHSLRGVLRPNSLGSLEPSVPSYVAYASTNGIAGGTIPNSPSTLANDFLSNPSIELGRPGTGGVRDAVVANFYPAITLTPGQSKDVYIYFGQSTTTPDFQPPLTLCVGGPRALLYNHGDFAPTPFVISGYVQNVTDLQRFGGTNSGPVTLSLNLPKGLVLTPDSPPATQQISDTAPGQEAPVSWRVVADGTVNGLLTYSVSVSSAFVPSGKTIQRTVEVPAPTGFVAHGAGSSTDSAGTQRWQMISVPLTTGSDLPSEVLGMNAGDFFLKQYSATAGTYVDVTKLTPGSAYWFKYTKQADQPINLVRPVDPNDPTSALRYNPVDNQVQPDGQKFSEDMPSSWVQVANPYLYQLQFAEIQVQNIATQQVLTFTEAAIQGWIMPLIWQYDTSDPSPDNWAYRRISNFGETMAPYSGYWIKMRRSGLRFILPGVDTPGAIVTRGVTASTASAGISGLGATATNWSLRLMAKGANTRDTDTYIGVNPKATDGLDNYKGEKPPVMNASVSVDSVNANTRLATDLRSPALGRKTWDILVRSVKPGEQVTLSWADIKSSVPRDYSLVLIDKDSNTRRAMGSTTSYAFTTNDQSVRNLQVVAEPTRGAGRMRVLSLDVTPNATPGSRAVSSVTVNYGLSAEAQAQIVIRDGRGRTLRTLGSSTRATSGATNSAVWDMRDQNGVSLPGGVYQIEVNATTTDGQRDRRVQPFLISR